MGKTEIPDPASTSISDIRNQEALRKFHERKNREEEEARRKAEAEAKAKEIENQASS